MRRTSMKSLRPSKDQCSETLFQTSVSRYLRAFARARAMRFWRPRMLRRAVGATAFSVSLAISASTSYAQFPAVLDLSSLNGSNGYRLEGIDNEDRSGTSVSGAGDVNGDGIDDLIIGAKYARSGAGESYVVFGDRYGVNYFSPSLDLNRSGFEVRGTGGSGDSVSGAGDFNGDGIDDLIIGAPVAYSRAGVSYVVFGRNNGFSSSFNMTALNGSNGFRIVGVNSYDNSGDSVSGAGDVNGDGIDDLIIGAPAADPNGNIGAGESYVVFGSRDGFSSFFRLDDLNGNNGFQINGIDGGALFSADNSGHSVSGAGDVNGDGIDDLIIGTRAGDANGNEYAGESYVVFGSSSGFPHPLNLSSLDGTNGFVINGVDPRDYSGVSVSGAGDVNGDGIDDLIIGASAADPNGNSLSGESHVVFGSTNGFPQSLNLSSLNGTNGFVINGVNAFDSSGESVSAAGDVNGDGIDDLIIGALGGNLGTGASYVVFGSIGSFSPSLELGDLDGTNGFVINGIDVGDRSGTSVSGAGDVNGDGIDDLIIGAPTGNFGAGESYVVFGRAPVLKGDVDRDGFIDFADIPSFIAVLQSGVFQAEADCDCNTVIDFEDIPAFIALLGQN